MSRCACCFAGDGLGKCEPCKRLSAQWIGLDRWYRRRVRELLAEHRAHHEATRRRLEEEAWREPTDEEIAIADAHPGIAWFALKPPSERAWYSQPERLQRLVRDFPDVPEEAWIALVRPAFNAS